MKRVVLLILLCVVIQVRTTYAQQSNIIWSDPLYLVMQDAGPSVVVADQSGDIHLFYTKTTTASDFDPQEAAVMYIYGRQDEWSQPLDILISPIRSAIYFGAVGIDVDNYLHLVWNDTETLFHSVAHVSEADNAHHWQTTPILKGPIPLADMGLGVDGTIHLLVRSDLFTVSYLSSSDGGKSWSRPVQVDAVEDRARYAIGTVKLVLASDGTLHATWFQTAAEVNWNFWSVWYGRSLDGGQTWENREMAAPLFGASDIAVDGDGNIHLVYGRNIGNRDGRWYQWSQDNGQTWSQRQLLFPSAESASGDTGGYGIATDSAGTLHLVNTYGERDGINSTHYLWWQGSGWSDSTNLIDKVHHAHNVRLVITEGNLLHVFAFVDGGALMYRYGQTSAPMIAPQAVPFFSEQNEPAAQGQNSTPESGHNELVVEQSDLSLPDNLRQPLETTTANPLGWAIISPVLLILMVVFFVFRRSRI